MTESVEVRRNIGYLPESVPLYPEMRVEEYLQYRAKLKGVDRKLRSKLEFSDGEWERLDGEITKIVEESVEFAKAGTDPKPEDALKNVYA